ncbi:Crp/Fnr family transcriptional regulator [Zunongwangia endophytica]|uniref:Crp/Fnr family transcriptional regulator n=1 Tax=Zunongwangia endophytica TaxID=1808945 RepID=A0ABV8H3U8_9FLAO|nr:Crp/Fnr family transcriptional regulator [Zunongwangia endophytica]MDN3595951.1 Crp/Fnr family transcriptional regulator [Zunongwangia endophytica]
MTQRFIKAVQEYNILSQEAIAAFLGIVTPQIIQKGAIFLRQGQTPKSYAYIDRGLFSYFHTFENGDIVIKKFFSENSFIASTSALLQEKPSLFTIKALEETHVLVYQNSDFRVLLQKFPEIAFFYINYLEKNWVVAKEPLEINLKYESATIRYVQFQQEYKNIENRLKKHQIASYLGITPTQLSRIRKSLKN